jgi:hypothetical protein
MFVRTRNRRISDLRINSNHVGDCGTFDQKREAGTDKSRIRGFSGRMLQAESGQEIPRMPE